MADLSKIIDQLRGDLQTSEVDLATAKEAAARIPEIEGEIERIQAAMKALGAPQTPSGRQRIAAAQKGRKRTPKNGTDAPEIDSIGTAAPSAVEPQCVECKGYVVFGTVPRCTADFCEANVCAECLPKHNARWHKEAKWTI